MTFSLGEAAALAAKAARGAGYPWALADEAGRAVRWCHAQGLDGCAALANLLSARGETDFAAGRPRLKDGIWRAETGAMCSVMLGTALSDRAGVLAEGDVRTGSVLAPLLVVPFLADAARIADVSLRAHWDGGDVVVSRGGLHLSSLPPDQSPALRIALYTDTVPDMPPGSARADPVPGSWDILQMFAHRTYAPATEASRLRGAGDGSAISE